MKTLAFALICGALIGCDDSSTRKTPQHPLYDIVSTLTDTTIRPQFNGYASTTRRLQLICIRNVVYYYIVDVHRGFMAPAFKPDGTLYTCK